MTTVSGYPSLRPFSSRLKRGRVPYIKQRVTLTCDKEILPLFLHLTATLDKHVSPILSRNTWSYADRKARMANADSDHRGGQAIDVWSDTLGAQTRVGRERMPAAKAAVVLRILKNYRTKDGRRIFGWGASTRIGGDYRNVNDAMHIYRRPGISDADVRWCIAHLKIKPNGTT